MNYSVDDIEQYLRGDLSPADMHAIEKAAMQDPFLADAIDGFRVNGMPGVKEDLTQIENNISNYRTSPAVTTSSALKHIAWWQVAASVILVAGATTVGWKLYTKTTLQNKPVSTAYIAPLREKKSNDTLQETAPVPPLTEILKEEKEVLSQDLAVHPAAPQPVRIIKGYDTIIRRREIVSLRPGNSPDSPLQQIMVEDVPLSREGLTDRTASASASRPMVNTIGNIKAVAVDSSSENKQSLLAINQGGAVAPLRPGKVVVDGYRFFGDDSKTAKPAGGINYPQQLVDTSHGLDEIVVIGYGTARKKDVMVTRPVKAFVSARLKSSEQQPTMPEKGWNAFNSYLSANLPFTQADIGPQAIDSVELNIVVDNGGKVKSTSILRSSNPKMNQPVIDVLIKGPAWIKLPADNQHFQLVLVFYR